MIKLRNNIVQEWPIWIITIAFILVATAYNAINPIHEGTDELRHYRFVRYIIQNRELPIQGQEDCRSQSHHPPLFYALGALATASIDTGRDVCAPMNDNPFWAYRYWEVGTDNKNMFLHGPDEAFPWSGEALAAHLIRGVNTILGAIAVVFTYMTARLMWPTRKGYAAGSASIVAFSPMFLYMSGTINNDVIAAMSGAIVIYTAVRLTYEPRGVEKPIHWGITLGYVYALALMSKFSLAPFAAILALALFIAAHRRNQFVAWWVAFSTMLTTTVALAGWWFARNYLIFGDPTGFQEVTELWGVRNPNDSWGLVWLELPNVWSSFWGRFGFGQIPMPDGVYYTLWLITLFSLGGFALWAFEKVSTWAAYRREPLVRHKDKELFISLFLLLFTVATAVAVVIAYMLLSPAGAMGRFLFPGLPAFAILLFWGLSRWLVLLRQTIGVKHNTGPIARLGFLTTMVMFIFALVALNSYLAPAYAMPPVWTERPSNAVMTDAIFSFAKLDSYTISQSEIHPGDEIDIQLNWEVVSQPPGNYYFFVHLIDDLGEMIAQRDTHPATGKFPLSHWQVGDKFSDVITIPVADTTHPATAELSVGFYAPEGYRLSIHNEAGDFLGDSYMLGELTIAPKTEQNINPLDYNFEDYVQLTGYSYDQRSSEDGSPILLTLYWESKPETFDTMREIELVIETTNQSLPPKLLVNSAESNHQQPKQWTTQHLIPAPDDLSDPVLTDVTVYLFDIFTEERVNTIARRGNWIDNEVQLGAVRFAPYPAVNHSD